MGESVDMFDDELGRLGRLLHKTYKEFDELELLIDTLQDTLQAELEERNRT